MTETFLTGMVVHITNKDHTVVLPEKVPSVHFLDFPINIENTSNI